MVNQTRLRNRCIHFWQRKLGGVGSRSRVPKMLLGARRESRRPARILRFNFLEYYASTSETRFSY